MAYTVRVASYNVESLFDRPKAMNLPTWADGRKALEQHAQINELFNELIYTEEIKKRIVDLLTALGLDKSDDGGPFALLRQNRGQLLTRTGGVVQIVATGRSDWIGWVELKTEPVNELATQHTAMVIRDLDAQIQCVVEADDRISLRDFSGIMLQAMGGKAFEHVMLIDGNDDRAIDVGILTRANYELTRIRSHVEDTDAHGEVFSRDCPEYTVTTPFGDVIVFLVNHLKSKGYGSQAANDAKRQRQATRVAEIYQRLCDEGQKNVVVLGDFNDTPDSAPLQPLLGATDLLDITTHATFVADDRPGTFGNGTKSGKIDYILLSPALYQRVTGGAIFRMGAWGGINGQLWAHYPTMTKKVEAASDHAAIYAELTF
jgi:endonuclease/exonuclease/phosphatase family metal-dependent hydrolase